MALSKTIKPREVACPVAVLALLLLLMAVLISTSAYAQRQATDPNSIEYQERVRATCFEHYFPLAGMTPSQILFSDAFIYEGDKGRAVENCIRNAGVPIYEFNDNETSQRLSQLGEQEFSAIPTQEERESYAARMEAQAMEGAIRNLITPRVLPGLVEGRTAGAPAAIGESSPAPVYTTPPVQGGGVGSGRPSGAGNQTQQRPGVYVPSGRQGGGNRGPIFLDR